MKNSTLFVSLLTSSIYTHEVKAPGIVKVSYVRTVNQDYDADKCHDGGCYFQPFTEYKTTLYGEEVRITVDDTSCGDFGTRYHVCVEYPEHELYAYVNNIDGDVFSELDLGNKTQLAVKIILDAVGYPV